MITLREGDCREVLAKLEPDSIDACCTDPPYGLKFMGHGWDHGVPGVPYWAEVLRVLKPGAHLLAFGGTRTYHRLACAIEDAGFEVRDQLAWIFGSGFPKSHNQPGGWGTALKPAFEPILLARKPLIGTVAGNMAAHGTGALNIDATRIVGNESTVRHVKGPNQQDPTQWRTNQQGPYTGGSDAGRWPANCAHDGSDEVLEAFARFGERESRPGKTKPRGSAIHGGGLPVGGDGIGYQADTGTAARFFFSGKATKEERGEGNSHPTVKPLALMRWLCRLITPPGGTVLDPFLGSGSTALAADQEGFHCIGIEMSAEYLDIVRRRIAGDAPLFNSVA